MAKGRNDHCTLTHGLPPLKHNNMLTEALPYCEYVQMQTINCCASCMFNVHDDDA